MYCGEDDSCGIEFLIAGGTNDRALGIAAGGSCCTCVSGLVMGVI